MPAERGVPQEAAISPLLANIYLHYAFDLWSHQWCKQKAHEEVLIIRYADDAVLGFQNKWDANNYLAMLTPRLNHFGLSVHPDKTRRIRFGRYAVSQSAERHQKRPARSTSWGSRTIAQRGRMVNSRWGAKRSGQDSSSRLRRCKMSCASECMTLWVRRSSG